MKAQPFQHSSIPHQTLPVPPPPPQPSAAYRLLNHTKAGQEQADKQHVAQTIYQLSKDSKYYQNEEKKDAKTQERIQSIVSKYEQLQNTEDGGTGVLNHHSSVDALVAEWEAERCLSQHIVHVDMDAFYAAVEIRDDPQLQGKPIAVGDMSMLSTSSYEARKYGVRAAMPGFIAKQLCPDLILVPLHGEKYREASAAVQSILRKYDPNVEMMSLDEGYLDVTETVRETGKSREQLVSEMRQAIYDATQLTASAGIACNRMLAKICSDQNKPNGQFSLPNTRQDVLAFISALPVRKVSGVGKVTEKVLQSIGIHTCADLFAQRYALHGIFSKSTFSFLLRISMGIGSTQVGGGEGWQRKSMSVERTFRNTRDPQVLRGKLQELAEKLAQDLAQEDLKGRTITVKLKLSDFQVKSRAKTLGKYVSTAEELFHHAKPLLEAEMPCELRLMGLRVSSFVGEEQDCEEVQGMHRIEDYFRKMDDHVEMDAGKEDCCMECPSCGQAVSAKDNLELNQHLDMCLNRSVVKQVIIEQPAIQQPENSKKRKQPAAVSHQKGITKYFQRKSSDEHIRD